MSEHAKPLFVHLRTQEQIIFCKRLAMLTRAGIPLARSLSMLEEGRQSKSAAYILAAIQKSIARGVPLSVALSQFQSSFGAFAIDIIEVGEQTGALSQNLDYLAEELKKKDALRKKVVGALIYPAIIVLATVAIALVLTVYIFPKITPVFQSFGKKLPLSTRILMGISQLLLHHGIAIFFTIALLGGLATFVFKRTRARRLGDGAVLRAPVFGRLFRAYHTGSAARSISLLLRADMRVVQALEIAAHSARNTLYQEALGEMAREVARGGKLSAQMQRAPRLFSSLCAQMVSVGEETGDLPGSLMYLAEMYEEEIGELTKNLATMLEPALMITMGLIVGFIAVSIITPIYGITQTLTPH